MILSTKDKRKQRELIRQTLSNERLIEEISAEYEKLQAGWGKLYRIDKQRLKEEIDKKIKMGKGEEKGGG
jgi:hypothetical protein